MTSHQKERIEKHQTNESPSTSSTQQCITLEDIVNENGFDHSENKLEQFIFNHCSKLNEEKHRLITINVSGSRFQTHLSTLELYPDTLLGNQHRREYYWNSKDNEYFFDRHRVCFESVLYFYQSNGRLHRPDSVPIEIFLEEISFFELGPRAYEDVRKNENITEVKHIELPKTAWRRYIWSYFEHPQYSIISRILYGISMLLTILSCISLSIETLPYYTDKYYYTCQNLTNTSLPDISICSGIFDSPFFIIETVCVIYFTLEFILRLLSTPSYRRFISSFYNWADLAAIIPYFVLLFMQLHNQEINVSTNAVITNLRLARVLRFLRGFKLYFIFKESRLMYAFHSIMKGSLFDLSIMFTILTLVAFLFGAATYFAELGMNDMFDSIPLAMYWGIMTITTVGYGDIYPITVGGRILACLCSLCGSAITGLLVSVLVERYQNAFNRKTYVSNWELSSINLRATKSSEDDRNNRNDLLSNPIEHPLRISSLSVQKKRNEHPTSTDKPQFLFSVYSDNTRTSSSSSSDHTTIELLERLLNVAKNNESGIYFKLIDSNNESRKISSTVFF